VLPPRTWMILPNIIAVLAAASCGLDSEATGEPPQEAALQSTNSSCDEVKEMWSFEATTVGDLAVQPRIHMLRDGHEEEHALQLVDANPETDDNRFGLELSIVPFDEDMSATQTAISCNDSVEFSWFLPTEP
jgi:hypothetical protein